MDTAGRQGGRQGGYLPHLLGTTHVPPLDSVKSVSIHRVVIRGDASRTLPLNFRVGPSACQENVEAPG